MGDGEGKLPLAKRRGAQIEPPNRFEKLHVVADLEQLEHDEELRNPLRVVQTEFLVDDSRSIVTENDSPDLHFRYSVNPYRGCEHGCAYCYARPYHEYLGFSAGLDFETKILVKKDAPKLLAAFLRRPGWKGEPIVFSGVTDCYQPVERKLRIMRQCLEVVLEARQPIEFITKNHLILRDLDLLGQLAARNLVHGHVAVTTLDDDLVHKMEPRTSSPKARLETIRRLTEAGVPMRILLAPLIPGLTDSEIPAILEASKQAGATSANYVLLRLPGHVREVFLDWLERELPLKRPLIESRIRATRDGSLNEPSFGKRMRGVGEVADQIGAMFRLFAMRFGLTRSLPPLDSSQFRPPADPSGQQFLF